MRRQEHKHTLAAALCLALLLCSACGDDDKGTGPNRPEVEIAMVLLPAGGFTMGSDNIHARTDERPVHEVTLTQDFYIGRYEVTRKQWHAVMGLAAVAAAEENLPADSINWYEAVEFCNKLSEIKGLEAAYTINGTQVEWNRAANGYRLPTEAEWEYACRAGTQSDFYSGDLTVEEGEDPALTPIAWYRIRFEDSVYTRAVGQKQANAFGLYDMLGNVSEWCWDVYGAYSAEAQTDPIGSLNGERRVGRGGSAGNYAENTRCAIRFNIPPDYKHVVHGMRLARNKE